jgi:hypothetical protein
MGATFWLVVAAAGVGGYLAFRKLQEMEDEIRDEIAARESRQAKPSSQPSAPTGSPEKPPATLEGRVLELIRKRPGLLQTEVYTAIPDVDRKQLQELLLRFDRAGRIRRVREKSTYRLFPV